MSNGPRKDAQSVSASNEATSAFFREVAENGRVWAIRDAGGFPTATSDGKTAMPFWSSLRRAESVIATVPAYAGFKPVELSWETFRDRWLAGMERDGLFVGVNWAGSRVVGLDLRPSEVQQQIEDAM